MFTKARGSARFARPGYQEPWKGSHTNIVCIRFDIGLLGTDFLGKDSLENK